MPGALTASIASFCAVVIGVAALGGALAAWLHARRLQSRIGALESALTALRGEFEVVVAHNLRTGLKVRRIEQEHSEVADRVEMVESRGAGASIDHAIEAARRGADPDKLAQQFGLSPSEAELVTRLHGRKRTA